MFRTLDIHGRKHSLPSERPLDVELNYAQYRGILEQITGR
jgi:hypothetical protein